MTLQLLHRDEAVRALLFNIDMNIFVMGQCVASLVEASITNRTVELSAIFVQNGGGYWALHFAHTDIAYFLISESEMM